MVILLAILLLGPVVARGASLQVVARAEQTNYVVGEPVRVLLSVRNVSKLTVRVPEVDLLDIDRQLFVFFEVTHPDKHVEFRRTRVVEVYGLWNWNAEGIPLAPADSLYMLLYPSATNSVLDERGNELRDCRDVRTFPQAGNYRLRVVFYIWPQFTRMGVDSERYWTSNYLDLLFHEATKTEAAMLSALWRCAPFDEMTDQFGCDGETLALIRKHPTGRLTPFLRLAVARNRLYGTPGVRKGDPSKAAEELAALREDFPRFRPEEVQLSLAKALEYSKQPEMAQQTIRRLMKSRPELWTDYRYAWAAVVLGTKRSYGWSDWLKETRKSGPRPLELDRY